MFTLRVEELTVSVNVRMSWTGGTLFTRLNELSRGGVPSAITIIAWTALATSIPVLLLLFMSVTVSSSRVRKVVSVDVPRLAFCLMLLALGIVRTTVRVGPTSGVTVPPDRVN